MIVIADAHVSKENGNIDDFFEMLDLLAQSDQEIIFLGDIFDLWIGLRRYEEDHHRRFIDWVGKRTERGLVGFVEGNHEFYVAKRYRKTFHLASPTGFRDESRGLLFVHGDLINRADKNYLRFRLLTKNFLTRSLLRFMPFGLKLAEKLKQRLKTTNKPFKIKLPEEALREYAEARFEEGVRRVLVGHFHDPFTHEHADGRGLYVLPAWLNTQMVAVLNGPDYTPVVRHWRALMTPM